MADARRKELDFFKNSPHYSGLKNVGTGFLSGKLSSHLINAIRKQLPIIQHSINDGIVDMERELEALGGPGATTRGAMVHLVLQARAHLAYLGTAAAGRCRVCDALWPS